MIQDFNPDFGVGATRGWCLKYVDDAGGVPRTLPPRAGTAKAAFYAEQRSGRLKQGDSAEGLWTVGFLDFTAGPYTKEGHVFFMKNLANGRYEIRDSEVGAAARHPYGSIAELLAWFGAYKPAFIGWSTDCDGRTYVKQGEKQMAAQDTLVDEQLGIKLLELWGRQGAAARDPGALGSIIGKPLWSAVDTLIASPEGWDRLTRINTFDALVAERDDLKTKDAASKPGEAEKKLTAVRDAFTTINENLK